MAEATAISTRLRHVQAIHVDGSGADIRFAEGAVGRLPALHDAFERALHLLRASLDRRTPVGVRLDDDRAIHEVYWVDSDTLLEMDEKDNDSISIFFQCHAGLYHLRRDHPDYPRLFALLHKAWREQNCLWFLSEPGLDLVDLQPVDAAQSSASGSNVASVEIGRLGDALASDSPS